MAGMPAGARAVAYRSSVTLHRGRGVFVLPHDMDAADVVQVCVDAHPGARAPEWVASGCDRRTLCFGPGRLGDVADGSYDFTYWYLTQGALP